MKGGGTANGNPRDVSREEKKHDGGGCKIPPSVGERARLVGRDTCPSIKTPLILDSNANGSGGM